MIRIGIDGADKKNCEDMLSMLLFYFAGAGLRVRSYILHNNSLLLDGPDTRSSCDIEIICAAGLVPDQKCNILIVNDYGENVRACVNALENGDVLLLNADNKELYGLLGSTHAMVITYGYNSKSSVTASSVTENGVQLCIQRGLPTFTGDILEQQEFSVRYPQEITDIYSVLPAISAALIAGAHK